MAPRLPIYLDHHATTPLDPRALEAMDPYLKQDFGNAASTSHVYGWRAARAVEGARESIAASLGAETREVVFTSGATEANNLALIGSARARRAHGRRRVVTLATEHPSVLDPARALADEGFDVRVVGVGRDGLVDIRALRAEVDDGCALVSAMAANNEIGVLQPIDEIGAIAREHGAWFHSDAAQAAGRLALRFDAQPLDLLSVSAHKFYGPKGVGCLLVRARRPRVRPQPILHGGGHEGGLRSGTLPVALIVGMARALEIAVSEREAENRRLAALRDRLLARLESELPGVHLNGHRERRLAANLNVSFEGVDAQKLLLALPGLALSTGSACSSAKTAPSHVLLAIGLPEPLARASLRFGLGRGTTSEQVETAADRVVAAVRSLR